MTPSRRTFCVSAFRLIFWLFALPAVAFGQGTPIVGDAYVSNASSSTASTNNGTSPSLVLQGPLATGGYTYIQFDLNKVLPANFNGQPITSSMVAKATLKVYATAVTAGGAFDVFEVNGAWCEKTGGPCAAGITYNNRPATGMLVTSATNIPATGAGQYYVVDVTQAVKDWLDYQNGAAGHQNFGLVLQASSGSSISVTFESKESTTTSHNAELSVVLSGPVGPQGPQGQQGIQGIQGPPGPQPFAGNGLQSDNGSPETLSINPAVTATVASLNSAVSTEVSNRNSAINTAVGAETARAQGAEATLTSNLNTETAARQAADTVLQANINLESIARSTADTTLQSNINAANTAITGEANRAIAAEATKADMNKPVLSVAALQASACTVAARDTMVLLQGAAVGHQLYVCRDDNGTPTWAEVNDESALQGQVTAAATQSALNAEIAARQTGDNTLTTNLSNEISRAQGAEATLQTNITNESAARQAGDNAITANLNSEISRAVGAENTLTGNLTNEITRASNSEALEAAARMTADVTLGNSIGNEVTRAQSAEQALTSSISSEVSRAQGAEDTKANKYTPVLTVASLPALPCTQNALVLLQNQPVGHGMFVCRDDNGTLTWADVNDESATVAGNHAYTDQQVANEAGTRQSADQAEIQARQQGDAGTLAAANQYTGQQVAGEAQARQLGDAQTLNSANQHSDAAVNTEAATRMAADAALGTSIASEASRALNGETGISASVTAEVSRATAAEATKADLVKPVQTDLNAMAGGTCAAVNAVVLNPAADSGKQLFICKQQGNNTLQWASVNDDAATANAANSYTDQAVASEAAQRQAVDQAEAQARQQGDADTLAAANQYTGQQIATEAQARQLGDVQTLQQANNHANQAASAAQVAAGQYTDQQVGAEALARQQGDAQTLNSANQHSDAAVNGEAAARMAADAALGTSIGNEVTRAQNAEQALTSSISSEASRAQAAEASKADLYAPVLSVATLPALPCTQNALVLLQNQPVGHELFVCRDNSGLLSWADINDESATVAGDHTYTDQQVTSEAAARQSGDTALTSSVNSEIGRAQNAEGVLTGNLNSEIARATGAENSLSASINAETASRQVADAAEASARMAADVTLGTSIGNEVTRATAAEANVSASVSAEASRATAAEATKADITKPVQLTNTQPPASGQPNVCVTGQLVLWTSGPAGQQLYACNASLDGFVLTNAVGASSITNAQLQNNSVTVNAGTGLSGGGSVPLGGTTTLSNAGVLSNVAGAGISVSAATGNVTISNAGVTGLAGTANQVNVSGSSGAVTLSLPPTINVNTTGSAATAISATNFTGNLAGDVTGTQSSTVVGRLQSRSLSSAAPANAQVLKWNGSTNQWEPAADNNSGGTVTSVATGAGLTGGPITGSGTVSLTNTGVTAGSYSAASFTVDAQGRVTAASSNTIPDAANTSVGGDLSGTVGNAAVVKIRGTVLGTLTGATTGQVLQWNGAQWVPASIRAAVLTAFCAAPGKSQTDYFAGFGDGNQQQCNSTNSGGMPITSTGTIKNLYVNIGSAGGNSTDKITVAVNGVTALQCQFGIGTSCNSNSNTLGNNQSFAVSAGDIINISVTVGASNTSPGNVSVAFELY